MDTRRGARSYERIHEAGIEGARGARTKGFTQNKECKYKVDGVDSEEDGDGGGEGVGDAYKMDVGTMHAAPSWRTRGSSSNTLSLPPPCRVQKCTTKGRFRKLGRSILRALRWAHSPSPPPRPRVFFPAFPSSVLVRGSCVSLSLSRLLHFPRLAPSSLFLSLHSSLSFSEFTPCLCTDGGCAIVAAGSIEQTVVTDVIAFNGLERRQRCRDETCPCTSAFHFPLPG